MFICLLIRLCLTPGVLIPTYSYYFLTQFGSFLFVHVKYYVELRSVCTILVLLTMPNWRKKWFCAFDPLTKKNGCKFLTFYIRPHSAVDSAQWDWRISNCFSGIRSVSREFFHMYNCIILQYTVTMPYNEIKERNWIEVSDRWHCPVQGCCDWHCPVQGCCHWHCPVQGYCHWHRIKFKMFKELAEWQLSNSHSHQYSQSPRAPSYTPWTKFI